MASMNHRPVRHSMRSCAFSACTRIHIMYAEPFIQSGRVVLPAMLDAAIAGARIVEGNRHQSPAHPALRLRPARPARRPRMA
jgi:hypothetical protein